MIEIRITFDFALLMTVQFALDSTFIGGRNFHECFFLGLKKERVIDTFTLTVSFPLLHYTV